MALGLTHVGGEVASTVSPPTSEVLAALTGDGINEIPLPGTVGLTHHGSRNRATTGTRGITIV